jgi:hypothetical protein
MVVEILSCRKTLLHVQLYYTHSDETLTTTKHFTTRTAGAQSSSESSDVACVAWR